MAQITPAQPDPAQPDPAQPTAAAQPDAPSPEAALPDPALTEAAGSFFDRTFMGNTVTAWAIALGVAAATFLVVYMIRGAVLARARKMAATERKGLADVLVRLASRLSFSVVVVVAVVVGAQALPHTHEGLTRALRVIVVIGVAWQALAWGRVALDLGLDAFIRRRTGPDGLPDPALVASSSLLRFAALLGLYAGVVLMAADNLGINVTALVAGLGVTGIAVALAVQNILGDLFSSLSIVLDKPFVVGDSIVVGEHSGTVERIGLKTTRVRSTSGEQLVFANSDLLSSRIRNFKRMNERRAVFTLGVTYGTPPEKLERARDIIREAIAARPQARFGRAHLKTLGPSSLDFEAEYFVLSADYGVYMETLQAVNLEVLRRFADEGIEFAYPTQTVFVKN